MDIGVLVTICFFYPINATAAHLLLLCFAWQTFLCFLIFAIWKMNSEKLFSKVSD